MARRGPGRGATALLVVLVILLISKGRKQMTYQRATKAQHVKARQLGAEAFTAIIGSPPSTDELRMLLAVSLAETTFGGGWKGDGVGSFNTGALQAGRSWTGPTFGADDTHPTPTGGATPYHARFRKYATALDGWKDLVRVLYVQMASVRDAARTGNAQDVAQAMHDHGYYEGRGATVEARIRNYATTLSSCLNEIDQFASVDETPTSPGSA